MHPGPNVALISALELEPPARRSRLFERSGHHMEPFHSSMLLSRKDNNIFHQDLSNEKQELSLKRRVLQYEMQNRSIYSNMIPHLLEFVKSNELGCNILTGCPNKLFPSTHLEHSLRKDFLQ